MNQIVRKRDIQVGIHNKDLIALKIRNNTYYLTFKDYLETVNEGTRKLIQSHRG